MPARSRDDEALIAIAVVTRPHGLRGEVRLHLHNPESTLLFDLTRVRLRHDGSVREVELDARPGPKGAPIARVAGFEGREAAEGLRGAELCVRREDLPPAGEDEWYHVDLVGLAVQDPSGAHLGEVTSVIPYPSVDCLEVTTADGVREVPTIEPWLQSVDLEAGHVVVDRLDELPLEAKRRGRKL